MPGKFFFSFLFTLLFASVAFSKKLATEPIVRESSRVRILELGSSDPNYAERARLIGQLGIVEGGGLYFDGAGFYGGSITLDTGKSLYFSHVSVEVFGSPPSSIPGDRYTGSTIPTGKRIKVLEIGASDTFYYNRGKIMGKTCTVTPYALYNYESDFFGGQVLCDDGTSYNFYNWALEVLKTKLASKPATALEISLGTRVKITSISSKDAYYSQRSHLVGKDGFVTSSPMQRAAGGYYSGSVSLIDGSYYYFSEVELEVYSLGREGSFSMGPGIIPNGTRVQIQAIGSYDSYFSMRKSLEGRAGVVGPSDSLKFVGDGFYSGTLSIEGKSRYFYQIAVVPFEGGRPSPLERSPTPPPTLEKGTLVRILDVSTADSYAKDKALILGKEGRVAGGTLSLKDGRWYAGSIHTSDGMYYYFSEVAVLVLGISPPGDPEPPSEALAEGNSIAPGTTVRVIDISPSDASYRKRAVLLSKVGVVGASSLYSSGSSTAGIPYFGGVIAIDGISYYPYQWSFTIVKAP